LLADPIVAAIKVTLEQLSKYRATEVAGETEPAAET
jgi:hypothetical protein